LTTKETKLFTRLTNCANYTNLKEYNIHKKNHFRSYIINEWKWKCKLPLPPVFDMSKDGMALFFQLSAINAPFSPI
jgi:hypothetical protein